ncbi:MAG: hypothetical protein ACOYIN_06000 [Christensenellales bacterium]|jgi:phosphoglucosamine mutase|nr:hypothetical protein [Clostridia bacterium]HRU84055.1 hypothetical protein [Eubacteriales bacterium]
MDKSCLFGTDGIRAEGRLLLFEHTALRLARVLGGYKPKRIVVARDTRNTSEEIYAELIEGLSEFDLEIISAGIIPTPVLAFLVKKFEADYGVMVTASHNPPTDNGLKTLVAEGEKPPASLEERFNEQMENPAKGLGAAKLVDLQDAKAIYCDYVKEAVNASFSGISITLDCCFGATAGFAADIFSALGASVTALCNSYDGDLVNVYSGSTHPEFLSTKMTDGVGFAFDGDGDRVIGIYDGKLLDGDHFLYYISDYLLSRGLLKNNIVVGTSMTNSALECFLSRRGVKLHRADVGDKYVLADMKRLNAALGGERSGHLIIGDYVATCDGIMSAAWFLKTRLITDLPDYKPYPVTEKNVAVRDKYAAMSNTYLLKEVERAKKLMGDAGCVLVRASGTEPVIRIMVEGDPEIAARILTKLTDVLREI